ncbi:hypothetical protein ACKAV7_009914 [Fusarium commune]
MTQVSSLAVNSLRLHSLCISFASPQPHGTSVIANVRIYSLCAYRRLHIAASPGLAYLIVVLRRIYVHLFLGYGPLTSLGRLSSSEQDDPILHIAWHPFSDGPKRIEHTTIAMKEVVDELPFKRLALPRLLDRTVQTEKGTRYSTDKDPDSDLLEFHSAQKLGQSLQSSIEEYPGAAAFLNPPVLSILYHSDTKQGIDINGLRTFHHMAPGQSNPRSFSAKETKYVLLAVVRLSDAKRLCGLTDVIACAELATCPVSPVSQDDMDLLLGVGDHLSPLIWALKGPKAESALPGTTEAEQPVSEYKDPRIFSVGSYNSKSA